MTLKFTGHKLRARSTYRQQDDTRVLFLFLYALYRCLQHYW